MDKSSTPSTGKILVTGDLAIDWFETSIPSQNNASNNWLRYPGIRRLAAPGGSLLLAELLSTLPGVRVEGPVLTKHLAGYSPEEMILSNAVLQPGPKDKDGKVKNRKAYYVSKFMGYSGPPDGGMPKYLTSRGLVRFPRNTRGVKLVVVDDAGNGFRNQPALFTANINPETILIHKMSAPLFAGGYWDKLDKSRENTVTLITANDLRAIDECTISRALSWERTAMDFFHAALRHPRLAPLRDCAHVVVLFGAEGAILKQGKCARLIFDHSCLEGDFSIETGKNGDVIGKNAAFTAAFAGVLLQEGIAGLGQAAREGLSAMRRLMQNGYDINAVEGKTNPPCPLIKPQSIFTGNTFTFAETAIPQPSLDSPDPIFWRILDSKTVNARELIAENLLLNGEDPALLHVPEKKFGDLFTLDRTEIENYGAIRNLMKNYRDKPSSGGPLCFAVFGAPGAGKSYGVKQIASELGFEKADITTVNLSQLTPPDGLAAAFHRVRDCGLAGRTPLVFFDEFDSAGLEWIKHFLAPMQDGEFIDNGLVYHIGKAVFVFAGGTRHCFEDFAADQRDADLVAKKLPDFISRLRGFVNVMGPNPCSAAQEDAAQADPSYIIRRAKLLRGIFERSKQAADIIDAATKAISMDAGVLRAFLKVPEYKHGIRSMDAVVQMSRLNGKRRFDKADLPPREQLALHVDPEAFYFLLERERLFAAPARHQKAVEAIAEGFHRRYIAMRQAKKEKISVAEKFSDLDANTQKSNRDLAQSIPGKLRAIGMGARPLTTEGFRKSALIPEKQVEQLAREEHLRWWQEREMQNVRNHQAFLPYEKLSYQLQEYDREIIVGIPFVLRDAGLEIFRMVDEEEVADPGLVEKLARAIHADYVRNRKKKGETVKTNPALKPFDSLDEKYRLSNLDNASHIPTKLSSIGCALRPVPVGRKPSKMKLTHDQVETMARLEHERWCWERRLAGWSYKPGKKDDKNLTSPYLIPYDKLKEEIKEYDRETVRLIPCLLAKIGYETYNRKSN